MLAFCLDLGCHNLCSSFGSVPIYHLNFDFKIFSCCFKNHNLISLALVLELNLNIGVGKIILDH